MLTSSGNGTFVDIAFKLFSSNSYLTAHLKTCPENGSHVCRLCSQKFQQEKDLEEHRTRLHRHDSIFICSNCSQNFVILCESGKDPIVLSDKNLSDACEQCGNIFSSKITLNRSVFSTQSDYNKNDENSRNHDRAEDLVFEYKFNEIMRYVTNVEGDL